MNIEELDNIHSQLVELATKRAADLAENGDDYVIQNTDRTIKGMLSPNRQVMGVEAGAQLQVGMILERKGVQHLITSFESRPGCKTATVFEIIGYAKVMQKTAVHGPGGVVVQLSAYGSTVPILANKGNEIVTARNHAHLKEKVLQFASGPFEVVGATISGNLAHLKVEPYQQPQQKALPGGVQRPNWLDRAPDKARWNSTDCFRGW